MLNERWYLKYVIQGDESNEYVVILCIAIFLDNLWKDFLQFFFYYGWMNANLGEVAVMEFGIDFLGICLQNAVSYIVMQAKDSVEIAEMLSVFTMKRPKSLLKKKLFAYRSLK